MASITVVHDTTTVPQATVPEAPLAALFVPAGIAVAAVGATRRRRAGRSSGPMHSVPSAGRHALD